MTRPRVSFGFQDIKVPRHGDSGRLRVNTQYLASIILQFHRRGDCLPKRIAKGMTGPNGLIGDDVAFHHVSFSGCSGVAPV